MEELIKQIQMKHGVSEEKARDILETVKGYIKEKFPMVAGAVDNLFQTAKKIQEDEVVNKNDPANTEDFLD